MAYRLGIDAGSKTIKIVVLAEDDSAVFTQYRRHSSNIVKTLYEVLHTLQWQKGDLSVQVAITGSAGISIADGLGIPFVQEVLATTTALQRDFPQADAAIELGGEDAKIIYLTGGVEQRMNATCAGGTGGFIDSIAFMLGVRARDMSRLAFGAKNIYPIASRCAVFAQTDVRPLINAGASKADIAASALDAVVRQTLGGLACGRPLRGTIVFLGGPLEHISALVAQFRKKLGLSKANGIKPPDAHLFTARGAALLAGGGEAASSLCSETSSPVALSELIARLDQLEGLENDLERLPPLFESARDYEDFKARHHAHAYPTLRHYDARGPLYLGIDAGSTTVKLACVNQEGTLVYSLYEPTGGDTLETLRDMLVRMYVELPRPVSKQGELPCWIAHATATGYGEKLICALLGIDSGVVETAAHLRAATQACPDVTFVLDIGGQDMKALWVREGQVTDALLNEACSSGCGSFVEGTAYSLRATPSRFANMALEAKHPVDLGTRCTVFMTSRVRHAQKVGAGLDDIAAGVAYSVVQNALYRIIGAERVASMGKHVVVQGGAFKSDAVLRAFELISGVEPIRFEQAHLMGAIGAALIARERAAGVAADAGADPSTDASAETAARGAGAHQPKVVSALLGVDELRALAFKRQSLECSGCNNACALSIVQAGDQSFISGNRCEIGLYELERRAQGEDAPHAQEESQGEDVLHKDRQHAGNARDEDTLGEDAHHKDGLGEGAHHKGAHHKGAYHKDAPTSQVAPSERPPNMVALERELLSAYEGIFDAFATSEADAVEEITATSEPAHNFATPPISGCPIFDPSLISHTIDRRAITLGLMNTMELFTTTAFWHAVLMALGFRVAVAPAVSAHAQASEAWETMPSESVCYPAKVSHLRYFDLRAMGASAVFMPAYERGAHCPVSSEYACALADNLSPDMPPLIVPRLASYKPAALVEDANTRAETVRILEEALGVWAAQAGKPFSAGEIEAALKQGCAAQQAYDQRIYEATEHALAWVAGDERRHGVVFLGRAYHSDRALSKGIDFELQKLGFAVLSLRGLEPLLRAQVQPAPAPHEWRAAKRFVAAARFVAAHSQFDVVGLQAFGCGYDAISYARTADLLSAAGLPCTVLKVDDIADLEHIRIRLRTLAAAIEARRGTPVVPVSPETHKEAGFIGKADSIRKADSSEKDLSAETPSVPLLGQSSNALSSAFAPEELTSFAAAQLDCDLALLRRDTIKDVCLTAQAMAAYVIERLRRGTSSRNIQLPAVCKSCLFDSVPYMVERATNMSIQVEWVEVPDLRDVLGENATGETLNEAPDVSLAAFSTKLHPHSHPHSHPRLGIVGNALMCFQPALNDHLVKLIESLGVQPHLPDPALIQGDDVRYREQLRTFREQGIFDILYVQSFGCLKGHVQARGALHELKREFPELSITVIDYDPEASALNRENRIRLLASSLT